MSLLQYSALVCAVLLLARGASTDKSAKRYQKYGEFIAELRRCFANSIKYNGAHLTSDTTGSSRMVYDAAIMMRDKLEGLLPAFTLSLCERVERVKIANKENAARMAEQRAKLEKEEAEAKKFEQKVLEIVARLFV